MLRAWSDGGIEAADKLLPALTTTLMQTEDARGGHRFGHRCAKPGC
jgi:hypothetical protein